jgi:hypothetical protein
VEYNLSFMGTKFLATKKKIFNLVKYIKGLIIKKRNLRGWRKRKFICGEGTRRFEPNLPLSEANFKIVERGNSGLSGA